MPKFNLNWMYMIIALMLLGLWWGSDSKGAGSKAVTYSEFQDYVKKGYVSKVLGYEDKSIEAFLKPTAVGAGCFWSRLYQSGTQPCHYK